MQPAMLTRVAALFLALTLANCAQNPVTSNPNLVLLSESQEIAVGRSEDPKVRQEFGVYDNAPLQQVVGEAARLKQASTRTAQEDYLRRIDRMTFGDSL